jgi:hypothetical protein
MAIGTEARSTFLAIVKGDASQAITEFKKLDGAVTKSTHGASGGVGKFQSAMQGLKAELMTAAKSPAVFAGGVAAAGAVAIMAANKFSQMGVQVGKFSDATGVATTTASRWLEVAGDIGISGDSLTGVFNKLNKSIDPKVFKELGVEIARTSAGNVDASETFLNVIDRLNGMTDPAERAQAASKLLGKGWTEVAELINMSADDIRTNLKAVGDEKVFDQAEVRQSRDYRAAMDNLNDAFEEIVITIGKEFGPAIGTAADALAFLVRQSKNAWQALTPFNEGDPFGQQPMRDAAQAARDMGQAFFTTQVAVENNITSFDQIFMDLEDGKYTIDDITKSIASYQQYAAEALKETAGFGDAAAASQRYLGLLAQNTRESADAATDLSGGARLAREQLKLLQDQIDGRKSFINLQQQLRDNATKIADLKTEYESGKISAEDYYLGVADAALESQGAVADYVAELDSISEEKKVELLAAFDPAAPAATINAIQNYADTHAIQLRFETDRETRRLFAGTTGQGDVGYERRASGGRSRGGLTLVGEYGPEMVNLPAGAMVSTAAQTRQMLSGGGGITVVVNAPVGANMIEAGRQVADALNDYYRSGGQRVA